MHTTYRGLSIHYHDQLEFDALIEEEFKQRQYYVDLPTNTPVIIDAGAHIGTSTLYLSTLYPHARFICIEPHPQNLMYLRKNLENNHIENFTIIPKALVGKKEKRPTIHLYSNNALTVLSSLQPGGWTGKEDGAGIEVETAHLSDFITGHVDFLKLDIEGAETEVIGEVQDKLSLVDHCILEFHKTKGNSEDKILKILKSHFKTVEINLEHKKKDNQLLFIEAQK